MDVYIGDDIISWGARMYKLQNDTKNPFESYVTLVQEGWIVSDEDDT